MSASTKKVLFIDRDGTIIEEPPDEQIDSLKKLRLVPGVIPALLQLQGHGYTLVMVSNQDGLGTPSFPREHFDVPHEFLRALLISQGIQFEAEFFCPHKPADNCECRKPKIGLLREYLAVNPLDREHSYVIGDRETDIALARNLDIEGIRIATARNAGETWAQIAQRLTAKQRIAMITRKT